MISGISKYSNSFMTVLLLAIFTVMVAISSQYPPGARFMTFVVGFPAIALCLLQLLLDARERRQEASADDSQLALQKAEAKASKATGHKVHFDVGDILIPQSDLPPAEQIRREAEVWAYFLALIAAIIFFGFYLSLPIFLVVFLRLRAGASWRLTLGLTGVALFLLFYAFGCVLRVSLHSGFATEYLLDTWQIDVPNYCRFLTFHL